MTPKVFIGIPVRDHMHSLFLDVMLRFKDEVTLDVDAGMLAGDGVGRMRNGITADFLASDCTHLFFVDNDLIFSAAQIERIVAHDKPIVGGLYPLKQEGPIRWCINDTLTQTEADANGLKPVRYIGTGFLCIKREVFLQMADCYPELKYKSDIGKNREENDFWSMGVYEYHDKTRRYLSEDWYFCQRALDMGLEILVDTKVVLKHIGQAIYPLKSQQVGMFDKAPAPVEVAA